MPTSKFRRVLPILGIVFASTCPFNTALAQQDGAKPFKLNAESNSYGSTPSYATYPSYPTLPPQPKAVPQTAKAAPTKKPPKPLTANISQSQKPKPQIAPAKPLMQARVQSAPPGVLPQQFMGSWNVHGSRSKVDCRPEFAQGIDGIFTGQNNQGWNITGSPGSYTMGSDTGVTSVQITQANQTTAFIRYQHPIKNTIAQEAIVMQLSPDGQSFQGLQRITIRKQGESTPRAEVTYQLAGRRN